MRVSTNRLDFISQEPIWPADLFICSSSFEERCLTIPKTVKKDLIHKAIILENANIKHVREKSKRLETIFSDLSGNMVCVKISTYDALKTADNIKKAIEGTLSKLTPQKIVVDITTFTHESLLILINLLHILNHGQHSVVLLYNSASDYAVGMPLKEKWLSRGVKGVRSILGYPGDIKPTRKMHLILFVGYESYRASQIIEKIEPSTISLGYGEPGTATNEKHEEASDYFHNLVKEMANRYAHVDCFPFSVSDPFKVKETILKQTRDFQDMNIVVAPLNTKLSTVGTGLAAIEEQRIQLCYAPAVQYNFEYYSKPSDKVYIVNLQ